MITVRIRSICVNAPVVGVLTQINCGARYMFQKRKTVSGVRAKVSRGEIRSGGLG
jgi:hypothetical protein